MAFSLLYWVNYTQDMVKLQRKSEKAVLSDRVLTFKYDAECLVLNSKVQASMKDTSYNVQVFLDDSYGVVASMCGCVLQNSKCHHVAASLLYGFKNVSKTQLKCSWLNHPKSAPPKETTDLDGLYPRNEYRALNRSVDQSDRDFMFGELSKLGRYTAMHWILAKEPERQDVPFTCIEELLVSPQYIKHGRVWLKEKVQLSNESIKKIAELTVGQRSNVMWGAVRKFRITASNFGPVLSAVEKKRVTSSLKNRLLSAYNLEKVSPIVWGVTHEKEALEAYRRMGGVVIETGIWLHQSGVIGASPDGIIKTAVKQGTASVLEIKCPYSARDMTLKDAVRTIKGFFLVERNGEFFVKETHDYFHQIQGQIYITGAECAHLMVWTPKEAQVINVAKDPAWSTNIAKIINFYFTTFLDLV